MIKFRLFKKKTLYLQSETAIIYFAMLKSLILITLAASSLSIAAEPPLVFESENTAIGSPIPIVEFEDLPSIEKLPDPFLFHDGSGRSEAYSDWEKHRSEILQLLQTYEIGEKPVVSPDSVEAVLAGDTLKVTIREKGKTLQLHSAIRYPEGEGPFPLMIGIGLPTGSLPPELVGGMGVASMVFNFAEVMSHTQKRGEEPINELYPDNLEMGAYAAWPWGISRLIDGLEKVKDAARIDMGSIGVTGCSFAGKMALFAGAMDERIALTIAQEPGGGGVNSWRVSETLGNVETIGRTNYSWFLESMKRFSEENSSLLPIDHHQVAALIAPRALLVLGNPDYEWLADESGYISSMAAREVWRKFGIEDRMGIIIQGGHGHCMLPLEQYPVVSAFISKFLLHRDAETDVVNPGIFEASEWKRWAPWAE